MSETVKLCVDCEHHRSILHICRKNVVVKIDPVAGEDSLAGGEYCHRERAQKSFFERLFGTKRCGPEGKYWKPKE